MHIAEASEVVTADWVKEQSSGGRVRAFGINNIKAFSVESVVLHHLHFLISSTHIELIYRHSF